MNKEFVNNVDKLFQDIVTDVKGTCNANDLLKNLLCKRTLPLKYWWEEDHLKMVYYNVSLDVESDLSSFEISYNKDYVITMQNLQNYDVFQLAEFVLALERDIPQWRHIWVADEELRKKKIKIAERIKCIMRDIRREWIDCKTNVSDQQEQLYRIRFYNVKATEMMLNNGNPYWVNKKAETEILDECNMYHIDAPLEQWFEEWSQFVESCNAEKSERERKRQEHQDKLMKMRHLINIKKLKLEAFLKTIELHDWVKFDVQNKFDLKKLDSIKYGFYLLTIKIDGADTSFMLRYDMIDTCLKKIVEYVKRINDIVSELECALREDNGRNQRNGGQYHIANLHHIFHSVDDDSFYITKFPRRGWDDNPFEDLLSKEVVNRLNRLCHKMRMFIEKCENRNEAA